MKCLKFRVVWFVLIMFAMLNICNAQSEQDAATKAYERGTAQYKGFNVQRDVVYKHVDNKDLTLDIALPEKQMYKNGAPVIMFIHGGGWHGGDRYHLGSDIKYYTDKGVACVTISYRLTGKEIKSYIRDCIEDSKDAARFLTKNAKKFGIDPTRIAVYGHSAGGHLTLTEVLIPNNLFVGDKELKKYNPKFVCGVGLAPIVTFVNENAKDLTTNKAEMPKRLGVSEDKIFEEATAISPITYLKKSSVPVMIIQGDDDTLVDVNSARLFVEKAKKIGANVEYIEIANAWHDFRSRDKDKTPSLSGAQIVKARRDFFDKYLFKDIVRK